MIRVIGLVTILHEDSYVVLLAGSSHVSSDTLAAGGCLGLCRRHLIGRLGRSFRDGDGARGERSRSKRKR